jgi:hypothetical protein
MLLDEKGEKILIEGSVSPLLDAESSLSGAVIAFRDMGPVRLRAMAAIAESERRLQERQLELSQVARLHTIGEMASGLSVASCLVKRLVEHRSFAVFPKRKSGDASLGKEKWVFEFGLHTASREASTSHRFGAWNVKTTSESNEYDAIYLKNGELVQHEDGYTVCDSLSLNRTIFKYQVSDRATHTQTECQLPKEVGRSYQGLSVRAIHGTASTNKRLSAARLPCLIRWLPG